MKQVQQALGVSERRACKVLAQARSTQQNPPTDSGFQARLRARIIALAVRFGRYGYRSASARAKALGPWLKYYNQEKPHGSLGGKTPYDRLMAEVQTT